MNGQHPSAASGRGVDIPLDDLPDEELADTLSYLWWLRSATALYVGRSSYQGQLALNLCSAGLASIADEEVFDGVQCWRVQAAGGRR